ncbi:MAG TPA: long-chain fatty acid--CoA ligase [Polyangia bacterium]|nr:long-chain fatty acid--CoA ligase [Polyangia bacterium]
MASSETIVGLFLERVREAPDRPALLEYQRDRWVQHGWADWRDRSLALAAALVAAGVGVGDRVAVHSYSRRQWVEADIAVQMAGAVTVPVYHNLRSETVRAVLEDSRPAIVFAEGPVQLRCLFGGEHPAVTDDVQKVVCFLDRQAPAARPGEPAPAELRIEDVVPEDRRQLVVPFEDFLEGGRALLAEHGPEIDRRIADATPGRLAKIVYTSGTTGEPKGAMLTGRNLTSVVEHIGDDLKIRPEDLCLLFLPLAHVYAQLTYHAALRCGFTLAFARSMLTAVEDARTVRPDFFTSVPRLFEKIHAGVLAQVEQASPIRRGIFDWAVGVGGRVSALGQKGGRATGLLGLQARLADRLVFRKLKDRLGGRLRFVVSGGAPLQKHLIEFFHAADIMIVEGYGMTENASLSNYNNLEHFRFGTVGRPGPGVAVTIAADGEILVRGPNVMAGYLNKPADTAESIDPEGWLHTGDIGIIDEDGFLTITDRKKDLIVTSGGKNVAPAPIEAALTRSRFVSQAVVFGDRRKFLVALLTLDQEYAARWAADNGLPARGEDLAADGHLREAVAADVAAVNRALESFSTVKGFAILPREFTMDRGEVTPSLKLRRRVIEERWREAIDAMYPPETGRC